MLVSINGMQFCANSFRNFYEDFYMKQRFALVKHSQTNGLVESAYQTILKGLEKGLDSAEGGWVKELPYVL